ncbi:beta-glucuronidase [Drosophila miranda]|uniref:beta-glucuronidase n=1 Tax=Drosophila miranda TaxID=7229 RepID=UPI0007E6ED0E|nr:beta-glucuronidase [Drosophila miranda]
MQGQAWPWMWLLFGHLLVLAVTGHGENNEHDKTELHPVFLHENWTAPIATTGLLYPRESETREVRSLDGMWRLLMSQPNDPLQGIREKWYENSLQKTGQEILPMPVPASYNDITTDNNLRDHVGTVWYERTFFVPRYWIENRRTWLRFGSVHYAAVVWINGRNAMRHSIGHLPFEAEITNLLNFGGENRITVMCNNRLTNRTVPQGQVSTVKTDNGETPIQSYTFDFFNYAGIHRSVHLYTTPVVHISDIAISTQLSSDQVGRIDYRIWLDGTTEDSTMQPTHVLVQLRDRDGVVAAQQFNRAVYNGTLLVPGPKLWWPYLMHPEPGYLYSLEFELFMSRSDGDDGKELLDAYRLPVGIRTLSWTSTSLLLNEKPLYLRGFGRHEDSDIRGKGLDNALLARDINLIKWVGANAYRTSHYPYSEESMQFADEHGIMVIDECSAVNIDLFEPELLSNHMSALEQLIHRDRNHASVIAWSVANEPRSFKMGALGYFQALVNYTRSIAHGRPLTAAINASPDPPKQCHLAPFLDIVGFNRYNAWYQNSGRTDMIVNLLTEEAQRWHQNFGKPVILFEYGADTMEGLHSLPAYIWSEDYQVALFSQHFKAFDKLRKQKWFIGEFVWNFADFKTAQTYTRVGGNKKGVFTRARQPKEVAHILRWRYFALAKELDRVPVPKHLNVYISSQTGQAHIEL